MSEKLDSAIIRFQQLPDDLQAETLLSMLVITLQANGIRDDTIATHIHYSINEAKCWNLKEEVRND